MARFNFIPHRKHKDIGVKNVRINEASKKVEFQGTLTKYVRVKKRGRKVYGRTMNDLWNLLIIKCPYNKEKMT